MCTELMHRTGKQLWLPPKAALFTGNAAVPVPAGAHPAEGSPRTAEDDRDADSEPDDLDALTRHYQAEAEAAKARAEGAAKKVALQNKGMAELRSDGLATPLGSDTKGFQMLAAMGYRPGTGIGRTVVGRAAPLDINLKADRTGLGVSEAKRRREQAAQHERQQREAKRQRGFNDMGNSFLHDRGQSFAQRRAEEHLRKARVVCETLDQRAGIIESHMWPLPPVPEGDSSADANAEGTAAEDACGWEALPAEQRLGEVLDHLRHRHFYCLYCGCQYGDEEDMQQSCPGEEEDDH